MGRPRKYGAKLVERKRRDGSCVWYIRDRVDGVDKWISTRTADEDEAKLFLEKYAKADRFAAVKADERAEGAAKTANKIAKRLVNRHFDDQSQSTPLGKAHDEWESLTSGHSDLSEGSKSHYRSIWERFVDWCKANSIGFIEEVDNVKAAQYAAVLWSLGITARTYNAHLNHLSRVFSKLDNVIGLPYRNPFNKDNAERKSLRANTVHHEALEPKDLKKVLASAAQTDKDMRDLFVIASNTGMRLKDACLLKWDSVDSADGFLRYIPHKTSKSSGLKAHVPISGSIQEVLESRKEHAQDHEYVIPAIADAYNRDRSTVATRCQAIFDKALNTAGTVRTRIQPGPHRKQATCVIGFHSFRVTYMSLLASKDVNVRGAMRMLGWNSSEMVQLYEKLLEKHRGQVEEMARRTVASIEELQMPIPEVRPRPVELKPTTTALDRLVKVYSNLTIGQIYGISDVAIAKWLKKYGVKRSSKRIQSGKLREDVLETIRAELLDELRTEADG